MIKDIWYSITNLGITEKLNSRETRCISYINHVTVITILYVVTRALMSIPNYFYSFNLLLIALFGVFILFLMHRHFYVLAKICTITVWTTSLSLFSYFYLGGFTGGSVVVLFATIPTVYFVFDRKQKLYIFLNIAYVCLCFITLIILDYVRPIPVYSILNTDIIRVFAALFTILLLILISWYFNISSEKAEDELLKTNISLENSLTEIRTLQSVLPICSYCKHIRDDEGSWEQLESYISTHSDTKFSHGICPDCLVKVRKESGLDNSK